jgi:5-methylcytosine-specific restriction protein A
MPVAPPVHRNPFQKKQAELKKQRDEMRHQQADERRDPAIKRLYNSARWRRLRARKLAADPLCECEHCFSEGLTTAANVVDHHIPHRGDEGLFYDWSNLRAMAKRCHDRKTARSDGGFGNPKAG